VNVKQPKLALTDAAEWLGDWHPLAEQLGSSDGLVALGSVSGLLKIQPVHNRSSLKSFLRDYQQRVLLAVELPAIRAAHGHAARNELRELVAFDRQLAEQPMLRSFANASRRVGQSQLRKLRPLRDHRMARRYLEAVETGLAHGWHTLVYGLTLEIYSLALRQGLFGYAQQTTRGFIYSATRMLELSEHECRDLFEELCSGLPAAIEALLHPSQPPVS
jgi:urease accessory protein UreF